MEAKARAKARAAASRILKGCAAMRLGSFNMKLKELLEDVKAIDLYLTGESNCRNRDEADGTKLLDGELWMVYLSDGGYTRLVIDPSNEEQTLRLTGAGGGSSTWDTVLERYKAIGGTYVV